MQHDLDLRDARIQFDRRFRRLLAAHQVITSECDRLNRMAEKSQSDAKIVDDTTWYDSAGQLRRKVQEAGSMEDIDSFSAEIERLIADINRFAAEKRDSYWKLEATARKRLADQRDNDTVAIVGNSKGIARAGLTQVTNQAQSLTITNGSNVSVYHGGLLVWSDEISDWSDQYFGSLQQRLQPGSRMKPVHVSGHHRKNGTYVQSHTRSLPNTAPTKR